MKHIGKLRARFPGADACWSRDSKFHLTLKFLGNLTSGEVADLSGAAAKAVVDLSPFRLEVAQAGAFPNHGPARVLWLGVNDVSGRLEELGRRLEDECAAAGFARDERAFHPHLTIARLRRPGGATTLAAAHRALGFGPVALPVSRLLVLRSELSREGSKHSVISEHALAGVRPTARTGSSSRPGKPTVSDHG